MQNCPSFLTSGTCNTSRCAFNHNILSCDACSFIARNAAGFSSHVRSDKHRRAIASGSNQVQQEGERVGLKHVAGGLEGPQRFNAAVQDAEKDKNGVTVEGDTDFGVVEQDAANGGLQKSIHLRLAAVAASTRVILSAAKLRLNTSPNSRRTTPSFTLNVDATNRLLSTNERTTITIKFARRDIGRYQDRLELEFQDLQTKKRFIISRTVHAIVGDPGLRNQLKAKIPYAPRLPGQREPETNIVEGIKPPSLKAISYVAPLPHAEIPPRLLSILNKPSSSSQQNIRTVQSTFLPKMLDSDSHGKHFKILMWIEEHRMVQDLERYDMTNSTLACNLPYYYLEVPGLAEKRPSVLTGDRILVRKHDGAVGHWYAGHVHFVRQYEVGLRFHQSFDGWSPSQKYHIRFKLNKIPLWRQHQALDANFNQPRILFPTPSHLPKEQTPTHDIKPFNSLILTNPNQLQAIRCITAAPSGSLPFIVFGPPGTGKTMTIVEAIKQLVKAKSNARILACAPSNAAADLIASRLRDTLGIDELFRLYAPSRHRGQVPDELSSYTYYHEMPNSRPCFGAPSIGRMKRLKVIVSTCVSASIIPGIGMPRGHFTHIFVDEAGQATEPEALPAIKMMADNSTNVILSGDPKQLGPIVRSGIASRLGLELSYLERLMQRTPYDLKTCAEKSIVKLVQNFRSHNAILRYPNERFYGGDLQACADTTITNSYLNSPWLPNKDFPVVFHSVSGKDDREASSPSFFNIDEVIVVKNYVQQLKADRNFRTTDQDIGVITPYHAQCQKIRSALRNVADEVKVASVEDFQGQERKVIIISTVRSSKEFLSYDIRHTLGFVASPRRFNVSVTRAKALLIVIGDPQVLGLDPFWRSFLNYVHSNDGWKGPDIPWDPSEPVSEAGSYDAAIRKATLVDMNDFTRRIEELTLEGAEEDMDAAIDRPWREVE
ncbi:RNA helicase [Macrolepiota fuliginosa MF-IS2]|uniref:RNA helicase n=1 Tax=Macrolepiota fuliginosa MF-IS2 TaxID=1400762 RepID=A0A9P5X2N2_9AGAR|nr:RNA helicase [Macrolepiota fuliginosa MF-IS2]